MEATDKLEFAKLLTGLSVIKPGIKLTAAAIEVYWLAMRDWSIDEFKAAASHLARSCEFMPNPYHFEQLRHAGDPTAGEAFARAVRHASSSAYRYGPLGDDATDAAVAALGGYRVIAMSDEDKLPFLERRFAEHYQAICDAGRTREAVPQIARDSKAKLNGPTSIGALIHEGEIDA